MEKNDPERYKKFMSEMQSQLQNKYGSEQPDVEAFASVIAEAKDQLDSQEGRLKARGLSSPPLLSRSIKASISRRSRDGRARIDSSTRRGVYRSIKQQCQVLIHCRK